MLLAISVDLDETHLYRGIHGLDGGPGGGEVYARAVPRLSDWARQRGIPLTWFVVGRDLEDAANAEAVARLAAGGDELGCHSFSHHYDLTRRPAAEMRLEIERGVSAIERASGVKVAGFRAPGYAVSDTLLRLLDECGFAYDSSVFPCPSYYALKAAKLAVLQARGRPSQAILDAPDMLRAPTTPYRVGQPYWYRGSGILELPVQVTRGVRLPFIGTSLALAGPLGSQLLARTLLGEPLLNLELHGIDALDRSDGLEDLAAHQRDLRVPWQRKLEAFDAAVSVFTHKGYRCVRHDELAVRARASPL
ncbi:MAG TPA: polysaccharide deacetylase family protein [Polyangiaceae bacterium]|nr:polysaccharide deacetylase family protein [Polyangiaceae bacterium]